MPQTVTGKFQVVNSNGKIIYTIDPDVFPTGSIVLTVGGEKRWELSGGDTLNLIGVGGTNPAGVGGGEAKRGKRVTPTRELRTAR